MKELKKQIQISDKEIRIQDGNDSVTIKFNNQESLNKFRVRNLF